MAENDPHKWLADVVDGELAKVQELIPKGAVRYVLATNIAGTAHPDVGSIDKVNKTLSQRLGIPLFVGGETTSIGDSITLVA